MHSCGKVDVVYDTDGREHGLKLLGDVTGEEEKKVFRSGASPAVGRQLLHKVYAHGLCNKHGARGECLCEGCATAAVRKGLLMTTGAQAWRAGNMKF